MNRLVLLLLLSTGVAARISAQPVAPTPEEVAALRAASQIDPHRAAASTPLAVNIASREETRQFYRTIFGASENVSSGWTGNYSTGAAGSTTSTFKDAVALRINFFRALAGVPTSVTLNSIFSAKDQQAALMMSGNNQLLHTGIPPSWTYYTAEGAEAASKSNLDLGRSGAASIEAYMADFGSGNAAAGHRRWLLYPQTVEMGTGDVPGNGTLLASNALWVQDGNYGGPRPATRSEFVSWPAPGYVPYTLVYPRWSFSYPAGDFSAASVAVTRTGASVPLTLEPLVVGVGENTLVWVIDKLDTTTNITFARPTADTVYAVTVSNVRVNGVARNFSYNVIVFDPDVAGPDFSPIAVTGSAAVSVGAASTFTAAKPSFASGFDWRSLQLGAFTKIYGAESGLDGLTTTTSSGYNIIQSIAVGAGASSYRLAHLSQRSTQTLLLPETFYVTGSSSAISLQSRLGIATSIEGAHVQVSTDEGNTWKDVFTQTGTSQTNTQFPTETDAAFVSRTLSLASFAGRTVRVRLAFTIDPAGVAFIPDANNTVGWFVDNFTLSGVQSVTASAATSGASDANFSFTPAVAGTLGLQARSVLFGAFPTEWGPVTPIAATDNSAAATSTHLINLSILTSLTSPNDTFTLGYVVGNSGPANPKPLVIRAVGPSLGALGVNGTLADPKLQLFVGSVKTDENDNWGGSANLSTAFVNVGAFPYASTTSLDAASLANITASNNSVIVSGTGSGLVLAEVYDATPSANFSPSGPRLINVSVLKNLGPGFTIGFVLRGTGNKSVVVRAVGPGLAAVGVNSGFVDDPKLTLLGAGSTAIATSDNWGGTAELTAAFTAVGAFAIPPGSKDAAVLASLAAGDYTVQVSGSGNTAGLVLVEVYELP